MNFEAEIEKVFDEQYDRDVQTLKTYRDDYRNKGLAIYQTLKNNKNDSFPKISFEAYDLKVETFVSTMQFNVSEIDKKIKEPSLVITLQDTSKILEDINEIISASNKLIQSNNDIVNNQKSNQKGCTEDVWKHIAFAAKEDVKAYKVSKKILEEQKITFVKERDNSVSESRRLTGEIRELSKAVVTTQQAIDNLTSCLKNLVLKDLIFNNTQAFQIGIELFVMMVAQ